MSFTVLFQLTPRITCFKLEVPIAHKYIYIYIYIVDCICIYYVKKTKKKKEKKSANWVRLEHIRTVCGPHPIDLPGHLTSHHSLLVPRILVRSRIYIYIYIYIDVVYFRSVCNNKKIVALIV